MKTEVEVNIKKILGVIPDKKRMTIGNSLTIRDNTVWRKYTSRKAGLHNIKSNQRKIVSAFRSYKGDEVANKVSELLDLVDEPIYDGTYGYDSVVVETEVDGMYYKMRRNTWSGSPLRYIKSSKKTSNTRHSSWNEIGEDFQTEKFIKRQDEVVKALKKLKKQSDKVKEDAREVCEKIKNKGSRWLVLASL